MTLHSSRNWACTIVLAALMLTRAAKGGPFQGQDEPRYDPKTVATFAGKVVRTSVHPAGRRGTPRSRATVETRTGTIEIHLGPSSFLAEKGLELQTNDQVEVIGSRVRNAANEDIVIVRQITRGKQTLHIRNDDGRPLWEDRHR